MRPRFFVHATLATLLIGGMAVAADAIVETDEEQLEQLVEDLTSGSARTDAVLRWMDLAREPVTVAYDGRRDRLSEQEDGALGEAVAEALAPFEASRLELVQRSVRVEGDRATVAVRVRADGALHDARFRLARSGQGWLVTDLNAN